MKNGKSAGQIIHGQLDVSKVTQLSCLVGHSSDLTAQNSVNGNHHSQSSMGCCAQLCKIRYTEALYFLHHGAFFLQVLHINHSTFERGAYCTAHFSGISPLFSTCPLFKQLNTAEEGQRSCWEHRQTIPHT